MFTQFVCACQRGRMYLIPSPSLLVTLCALWRLTRTFHYARRSTLVDDIIAAAVQKVFLPLPLHLSVCTASSCHSFGRIFRQWLWAKGHSRQILLSVCALHGSCGATLIWQRRRRRQKFSLIWLNLSQPNGNEAEQFNVIFAAHKKLFSFDLRRSDLSQGTVQFKRNKLDNK